MDELAGGASRMSGVLLAHETVDTVLRLITMLAVETIAGSTGAGVTLIDARGQPTSAAATDPSVERADAQISGGHAGRPRRKRSVWARH